MDWLNYHHLFHFWTATREIATGLAVRIVDSMGKARERLCAISAERREKRAAAVAPVGNAGLVLRGARPARRVPGTRRGPQPAQT